MMHRSTKNEEWKAIEVDIVESAPHNSKHNKKDPRHEYDGVGGHLFAEAVRQSVEAGYGGYVTFMAKTNLIDYYTEKMHATQMGSSQMMYIAGEGARELYEKYYGGK